jgi:hypothetical protein
MPHARGLLLLYAQARRQSKEMPYPGDVAHEQQQRADPVQRGAGFRLRCIDD